MSSKLFTSCPIAQTTDGNIFSGTINKILTGDILMKDGFRGWPESDCKNQFTIN